ncbi:MAG: serine/threonine-protein kinase [Candidatus Melainabacteria bacterium]|nr:serine/threonine-protein kinase [Candidatus Melainabacteria bacterium]
MFDVSMCGTGYKLLKEVGSGGMGKVYQAQKSDTGEICAIKVMHNHLSADQNNRKRFEREARVTCGLNQENVVETIDCGVTKDDQPFIVMEYLEGNSLADMLLEKGRIDLASFYPLLVQICRGLAYTHNMSIVHRDMKPSNIMLVKKGNETVAKIVDFGIAKICPRTGNCMSMSDERLKAIDEWNELDDEEEELLQVLTAPGEVFGSPLYMSPEQCRGEIVDCCSEVYSLGCMIFECLTGVAPLKGRNAMETLFQRITMDAPSINSVAEGLTFPAEIQAIVAKALEKERRERYQSVCELKTAVLDAGKNLNLISAVSA